MNIAVCVKAISTNIAFPNVVTGESYCLNPYDMFSLKEVIDLKKSYPDIQVTCLCMGPPAASETLTRCIAMGADAAIHLNDISFAGSDTFATSLILSAAFMKLSGIDLIVCGSRSSDGETGQIVYQLAERLSLQCFANVKKINSIENTTIKFEKVKDNVINIYQAELPIIISFNDFCSTITSVGLLNLKRARKKNIQVWTKDDLTLDKSNCGIMGSKTKVLKTTTTIKEKDAVVLNGTDQEIAVKINSLIRERLG
ncbi:electron transfer flavoprotein subunit beta/FixA family protein [Clostridium sp. E02]|uniref:electron transfer flavoprotein subunit beta/FixA family protein n=1 Tax=Clostridium sp. E02 TaxID=2487134 RepID=UPI000F51B35F|nr:electron transfer flavoprotein subunit beta/FixA family protein [Clostridium sp. E02]